MTRALVLLSSVALVAACASEKVSPLPTRESGATTLGLFSRELPSDPRERALATLERDARRRDVRYREVLEPGFSFRATRVPQREIDAGLWSPGELFELGAQLFHQRFRREDGFGGADLPAFGRFQRGERGGPDAHQCADCHRRGGPAGAGDASDNAYILGDGERPSTALERNPRALVGAGLLELVAHEMSADLARRRGALLDAARSAGTPRRAELSTKGISFGFLTARPDGSIDTSEVSGIDADLVVRPFGWKGHTATLREFVESELATHHGMQSEFFVATASSARKGDGPAVDPDGDGVAGEIAEGQVTALAAYLAMQEVPTVEPPLYLQENGMPNTDLQPLWNEGLVAFREIGCASCHAPALELESTVFNLPSRTGGAPLAIDLAKDGAEPRLAADVDGRLVVRAFTDMKRHDIGEFVADAYSEKGYGVSTFVTPPLWGIARSRPYLHDGRAPTLEDAILMHRGEAEASRAAYLALTENGRAAIRVFLTSLTRARRFAIP